MADVGRVLVVSCSSFLSPEDIINGEKIYSLKTKRNFSLCGKLSSHFWWASVINEKFQNKFNCSLVIL